MILRLQPKLLKTESVNRILVIDLDVHQGDGTAEILEMIQEFKVSLHGENNFPFRKKQVISIWDSQMVQKMRSIYLN